MKRAALYVRVSTQEQKKHGMSVDSQIAALEQYCADNGLTIAGLYNDAGISARKTYKKRPALLSLMQDCSDGKIDIVLFTKLDRWFRSVADYYDVQRVLDNAKVPWKAIWEDYDTETSSGTFKVNIMLSVAQAEADRTSDRIKAVNQYRRDNGEYINGIAPTGYKVSKSKLYIDKNAKEAVKAGFDAFLLTFNCISMQKEMRKYGVCVTRQTCKNMLQNPTYYGDAYGHKCDPYITKEQWDKIQDVLQNRRTRPPKNHNRVYIFAGIIKCECCGLSYSGTTKPAKGKNGTKYVNFYRCTRGNNGTCENRSSISEKRIERTLLESLDSELKNYTYKVELEAQKNDAEERRKELKQKIRRIGDRYEFGEIDREEYVEKVSALKEQLESICDCDTKVPEPLPDNWKDIYNDLDELHRKQFWNTILKKVTIGESGIRIFF